MPVDEIERLIEERRAARDDAGILARPIEFVEAAGRSSEFELAAALNAQIRAMYADGSLAALVTKYGGDPDQFLKPTGVDWQARIGVDRTSDWQPPTT